jgi:2-polyprenyl-6-methoxyphenol hydroxylase-like FAD-dependent oxidoreductase
MAPRVEWGRDTCVLLGDAAHALSPTFSEGGSLALEDAVVLGVALKTFEAVPEALAHFRAERTDRVVWAYRMAQSQVSARRRERTGVQLDATIATAHLREMYRRLRQPLLTSVLAARLPLVDREPTPSFTT